MDGEGVITGWNVGAETVFGYTSRDMVGRHFRELFVPEDRIAGEAEKELETARQEGRAVDERWHLRKDGSRVFCSGTTTRFALGDGIGFAKIARDLSERQQLESKREELL